MFLALLKLAEVGLRLAFLLGTLYLLDARAAGQFGLLNTLITFYAFAAGFERHGALQRMIVTADETQTKTFVAHALRFFCLNYALLTPALLALAYFWLKLPGYCAVLAAVIALCEHISSAIYNLSVIAKRYQALLVLVVSKNVLLLIGLAIIFAIRRAISLELVIMTWAGVSILFIAAIAVLYLRQKGTARIESGALVPQLLNQYRVSFTHFLIGLVALSSGLIDRVITGAIADLAMTGIYFKNLTLASSLYQAVTIFFHNQSLPSIYESVAHRDFERARRVLRRDALRIVFLYIAAASAVIIVFSQSKFEVLERAHLQADLLVGLLFAFLLRSIADYNNTFLNAYHRERLILVAHSCAIVSAGSLNIVLTMLFGIWGTVVAVMAGSATLLAVTSQMKNRTLRPHGSKS